jgi:hypothetical protein
MFLVEHYRPGLSSDVLAAAVSDVRAAAAALAAEGRPLAYLRSAIVPDDEAYLSFFRAASKADVCAAYDRACVHFDRISEALPAEPEPKEEACAESH